MVDLVEIQAAYYMVAATGVLVAAVFYMINLRETTRNRQATYANNQQQLLQNPEFSRLYIEVVNMQWRDFDDFKNRFDSSVSAEDYAKRQSLLMTYDQMGWQLRRGLINSDSFPDIQALGIVTLWHKFKPIIEGYRGWQYSSGAFRDFEYLAGVLERKMVDSDPDFMGKMNTLLTTPPVNQ